MWSLTLICANCSAKSELIPEGKWTRASSGSWCSPCRASTTAGSWRRPSTPSTRRAAASSWPQSCDTLSPTWVTASPTRSSTGCWRNWRWMLTGAFVVKNLSSCSQGEGKADDHGRKGI